MKITKASKKESYKIESQNDAWHVMAFDAVYYAIKNNPRKYIDAKYGWKTYFLNTIIELRKSKVITKLQNKMLQTYFFEMVLEAYDYHPYFEESCYRNMYLEYHELIAKDI